MFITAPRKEVIDFSEPFYSYGEGLLVPKGDSKEAKEAREKMESGEIDPSQMRGPGGDPQMQELNPELQKKVITTGLSTFYSQSSAQAKAELAPLLEEMQRSMERGAAFRGQRRPNSGEGGGKEK